MQRIVFVESRPAILTATALLVGQHCAVCTLPSLLEAIPLRSSFLPDLLVVEVPRDAVEWHSTHFHLTADFPQCPVIVITANARGDIVADLSGVRLEGLFTTPTPLDQLVACVMRVARLPRVAVHRSVVAAVEHMVEHYAERPTLKSLALAVGASRTHLAMRFRRDTGMTLMMFLTRFRLEVAKALLRTTDDKLDTIATLAGFCDASHLSRVFQDTIRMRPGLYRRQGAAADVFTPLPR